MKYDVLAIGNAIVDTEIRVEEKFLRDNQLQKGLMTLSSFDQQDYILQQLREFDQNNAAGGSAANTVVGIKQFGGSASFIGKVGMDRNGELYRESMTGIGVQFAPVFNKEESTGSCVVLVTPDGERTMQTNLAASATLVPEDIDLSTLILSKTIYVEGYLYSSPSAQAAATLAMQMARDNHIRVALTLSDPGIVTNFMEPLRNAVENFTDILFCNDHEAQIFSGSGNRTEQLKILGQHVKQVFMTCGADGAMVYDDGQIYDLPGYSVEVIDTTGAGDIFAAGVLFGLSKNMSIQDSTQIGLFASAKIVTQRGPRLKESLTISSESILTGAHPSDT